MLHTRTAALVAVFVALSFALVACASTPAAPSPTQPPQAAATALPPTATPEQPTATPIPPTATTAPSPTPAPPTATPVPPTPTLAPTVTYTTAATPTAARLSDAIVALLARSKGITEYSFDLKLSVTEVVTADEMTGKCYVKGTKIRQELVVSDNKIFSIGDYATRTMYAWFPGQRIALRTQMPKAGPGQAQTPSDVLSALPTDAEIEGTETVDGKTSTMILFAIKGGTQTVWIWNERGLPLKAEVYLGTSSVTTTYSNYKFAKQPDSLFVLPKGLEIREG